jgi:hypothetical protein
MKRKRKTKHDHEAIIASAKANLTDQEISTLHNCPLPTVRKIRLKAGILKTVKIVDYDKVMEDVNEKKLTVKEIALKHNCAPQTITRIKRIRGQRERDELIGNTATVNYLNDILKPMLQNPAVKRAITFTEQRLGL